jgi:hypothetical protein
MCDIFLTSHQKRSSNEKILTRYPHGTDAMHRRPRLHLFLQEVDEGTFPATPKMPGTASDL